MQVRPLEVVLTLFIGAVMALSLREATLGQLRQSRIASAAAGLETLVSARASGTAATGYRHMRVDEERDRAIGRPLIRVGTEYLRAGRVREAIAVFEITVETVPESWTAWRTLAAAYEAAGDRARAAAACAKSVALRDGEGDKVDRLLLQLRTANEPPRQPRK